MFCRSIIAFIQKCKIQQNPPYFSLRNSKLNSSVTLTLFFFFMWSISTDTRSNLNSNHWWEENRANTGGGTNNVHTHKNAIWIPQERCTDKPEHKMKDNTRSTSGSLPAGQQRYCQYKNPTFLPCYLQWHAVIVLCHPALCTSRECPS